MLSSAKIGSSSWRYYQDSVAKGACEYYLGAGEKAGVWEGRGLPELGLEPGGQVSEAQLEAIFARALHPVTGQALGRAWRVDAVTGFDLTFSAPKSVSALWALGGVTAATQVSDAHRAAVAAALTYLDSHAGWSRRGTDGVQQIATKGLVAALFDHRTSRAGDPQLHTHALVPNKLLSADGVWRTIDGHEVYHHKIAAGAIYQAALRGELTTRLGVAFGTPNVHGQAEILGVPTELMTGWSKRTAQILAEAAPTIAGYEKSLGRELGRNERAAVTKAAVLKTRPAKEPTPEASVLHARWRAEAGALGWDAVTLHDAVTVAALATPTNGGPFTVDAWPAVTPALSSSPVIELGRRRGVFSRADLTVQIAATLTPEAVPAEQTRRLIEALTYIKVADSATVDLGGASAAVTPRASDARFTSVEVLQAEARILRTAASGAAGGFGQVTAPPTSRVEAEVVAAPQTGGGTASRDLAPDQLAAVQRLTTGGDFLTVITAPAGAGKTTTLGAAARSWQANGYQVVGLAPSARAAAELANATGTTTDTLAKWLHEQARTPDLPTGEDAPWAPTRRTVLVVDEASMASTFDLDTLTAIAYRAGAKVVLVGDPAQIGVINGPGGMLAALATRHGVELTGVHRFRQHWEAAASLRLRDGDQAVLSDYHQAGRIHPIADQAEATAAVFAHWQHARADGSDAMMLARTRDDVDQLNALAKTAAQTAGVSHGPELVVAGRSLQAGDLIRTRRNDRSVTVGSSHVRNGDRYLILATTETGALLVQQETGPGTTVLPPAYVAQHVEHGWASTIDAAQGATTDIAVVLVRPGIDRRHLYVGLTRGRDENHVYIAAAADDDEHGPRTPAFGAEASLDVLRAALARTGQGDAAHTLLERAETARQNQPEPVRTVWAPTQVQPSTTDPYARPSANRSRGGISR